VGDITKNISQHELNCECGAHDCRVTIHKDEPVIKIWQKACDHFARQAQVEKMRLEITSGARCYTYNRSPEVGSSDMSQHPRCCAIDGKIFFPNGDQVPPQKVYEYFDDRWPDKLGLGNYKTFTHVDTRRTGKARW
jgi:hypothetical protein